MTKTLKDYILSDMGFSATDKSIITSLLEHDADSNFHYDNTNLPKAVFERHLKVINRIPAIKFVNPVEKTLSFNAGDIDKLSQYIGG